MVDDRERRLLQRFEDHGRVSRLSGEVEGEQVIVFVRDGALRTTCTCGALRCDHGASLLSLIDGEAPPSVGTRQGSNVRGTPQLRPTPATEFSPLADAFDALLLAVVRSGITAVSSPSVRDAMDRIAQVAPKPVPLGVARWLGRLHDAMHKSEVGLTAGMLEGARRFADELREEAPAPEQRAHRNRWLSARATGHVSAVPLESVTLLEVAREWLSGLERSAIERRYLLDLSSGEIVREERARSEPAEISVGPCPRVLQVAFGEVEPQGFPPWVRLLQYTVSVQPTQTQWSQTHSFAKRWVREAVEVYERAMAEDPGLAEPFVLVAPTQLDLTTHGRPAWLDPEGRRMALGEDPGRPVAELLAHAEGRGRLVWLSGRLLGLGQGLVLLPASLLVEGPDGPHLWRVS